MISTHRTLTRADHDEIFKTRGPTSDGHGLAPMSKTPYGIVNGSRNTPHGVPCSPPPFGTISAIDLESKKVARQVPAGTAEKLRPPGLQPGLPLTPGMSSCA